MKKKLYHHLATLSMILLLFLLLSFSAAAQDLPEAQRLERCQNNKNRLAELETQRRVIEAELAKTMPEQEIEDTRGEMVFVKAIIKKAQNNKNILSDFKTMCTIADKYNFEYRSCINTTMKASNMDDRYICFQGLDDVIAHKIDKAVSLQDKRRELINENNEINKQIANHRNNLIALGCEKETGPISAPDVIKECEGGFCGTWTRQGNQFNAVWNNGAKATLTIAKFDNNQVIINRKDIAQSVSQNFYAEYTGKISGNQIVEGKVTYNQNGRTWYGTWTASW